MGVVGPESMGEVRWWYEFSPAKKEEEVRRFQEMRAKTQSTRETLGEEGEILFGGAGVGPASAGTTAAEGGGMVDRTFRYEDNKVGKLGGVAKIRGQ